MLRFNGQSPTSANGAFSAFPGRNYGTVSGIALQTGMIPLWRAGRAQTGSFGEFAGQPDGTLHPVSWLMGLYPGRISSRNIGATFTLGDLTVVGGKNTAGSTDITFTVGPSQLNLIVSAVGNAAITFTLTGLLQSVAPASGNANITFTVGPSTLGALAGVFGNVTVTIDADGVIQAIGNLSGAITPYTELSPQNLAAAVWQAIATEYNDTGTMGNKLNLASSGGIDYDTLAQAVWTYVSRTLTSGGNDCLTLPQFLALKD